MSDNTTVARPYAKAIFEFALDTKSMVVWSDILTKLTQIVNDKDMMDFIRNPSCTPSQKAELISSVLANFSPKLEEDHISNILNLLSENHRLQAIPDITIQFQLLRREFEKTLEVQVISFAPFTKEQEQKLVDILSKKLQRSVSLDVSIDKSLQGGAVIRAGHLVFDASVRTQIKKLNGVLAA
ncbi:MAG: ATP synthase F1 subunit delta [Legionellales bacterium RIFCSPHIGHO2_12_FULL_35_11]|nr:MAG: ATP synthase F1 subunit delta [Legionellales bacterium RIFCSPHIGHO2_12_FULL_35_11]